MAQQTKWLGEFEDTGPKRPRTEGADDDDEQPKDKSPFKSDAQKADFVAHIGERGARMEALAESVKQLTVGIEPRVQSVGTIMRLYTGTRCQQSEDLASLSQTVLSDINQLRSVVNDLAKIAREVNYVTTKDVERLMSPTVPASPASQPQGAVSSVSSSLQYPADNATVYQLIIYNTWDDEEAVRRDFGGGFVDKNERDRVAKAVSDAKNQKSLVLDYLLAEDKPFKRLKARAYTVAYNRTTKRVVAWFSKITEVGAELLKFYARIVSNPEIAFVESSDLK